MNSTFFFKYTLYIHAKDDLNSHHRQLYCQLPSVFFFFRLKDVQKEFAKCDVVLFEGILPFYHKEIRDLFDMKLFVDSDADIRLSRRGKQNIL